MDQTTILMKVRNFKRRIDIIHILFNALMQYFLEKILDRLFPKIAEVILGVFGYLNKKLLRTHKFVCWKIDGKLVGINPRIKLKVNRNVNLVACLSPKIVAFLFRFYYHLLYFKKSRRSKIIWHFMEQELNPRDLLITFVD